MSELLTQILQERPENVVDIFEEMSRMLKRERYISHFDVIRDEFEPTSEFNLADSQKPLFEKTSESEVDLVIYLLLVRKTK